MGCYPTKLDEILSHASGKSRGAGLDIRQSGQLPCARPNRAGRRVLPPNADLLIESYAFKVVSPRSRRNAEIDICLTTLSQAMGVSAIGIILSGYDGDGAQG
jgi:hypothetical protein